MGVEGLLTTKWVLSSTGQEGHTVAMFAKHAVNKNKKQPTLGDEDGDKNDDICLLSGNIKSFLIYL